MKAVKIILLSVGYTVSGLLFALVFLGQMLSWWRSGVLIGEPFGAVLLCIPLSVMLSRPWEELAFAPREDPAILAATERARARGEARMKEAQRRKVADDDELVREVVLERMQKTRERSDCGTLYGVY